MDSAKRFLPIFLIIVKLTLQGQWATFTQRYSNSKLQDFDSPLSTPGTQKMFKDRQFWIKNINKSSVNCITKICINYCDTVSYQLSIKTLFKKYFVFWVSNTFTFQAMTLDSPQKRVWGQT